VRRTWPRRGRDVAETWPDRLLSRAAGLMQSGLGVGFSAAALIWFFVGPSGARSWRWMFVIGVLPALFAPWLRRRVPASPPNALAGGPPQQSSSPARSCSYRRCSSGLEAYRPCWWPSRSTGCSPRASTAGWRSGSRRSTPRVCGVRESRWCSPLLGSSPASARSSPAASSCPRRLRYDGGDVRVHLPRGSRRGLATAGDQGPAAAGRLTRASPPPAAVMAPGCPERCRPPRRPLGRRGLA